MLNGRDKQLHNWVPRADLQPDPGRSPDHIAVDETVIQLDDEQYWLSVAINPESHDFRYTTLETTRNHDITSSIFRKFREKHGVVDVVFLIDGDLSLNDACQRHSHNFRTEQHGNRTSVYIYVIR